MARRYYSSVAVPTTLSSSVTDSATTLPLAASTGFPSSYPFTLIVDEDTAYEEVVTVTASLGGNSFTVTRGVDGTTAQAHSAGAAARHGFSKRDLDEPNEHVNASAAVHGLAGTVVGTSDTQTLSNKTITSPTITTPTLTLKQSASPTPTAEGDIQWDSDDNTLKVGDSVGTKTFSDDTVTNAAIASVASTASSALSAHEADTSTHGVTTVAGLTETQTFTNKTLTTPTIASFVNATHDHSNAAGGGTIPASSITNAAWTAFTPTWQNSSSPPTLGNGVCAGYYQRMGRTINFAIYLEFGTTTSVGVGAWSFTGLPASFHTSGWGGGHTPSPTVAGYLQDESANETYKITGYGSGTTVYLYVTNTAGTYAKDVLVASGTPITFALNDRVFIGGTYEAAS